MVGQDEVFVDGKGETLPNVRHNFRLLHRVDAQFALKVLVQFNKISRVAGVVNHHINDG